MRTPDQWTPGERELVELIYKRVVESITILHGASIELAMITESPAGGLGGALVNLANTERRLARWLEPASRLTPANAQAVKDQFGPVKATCP